MGLGANLDIGFVPMPVTAMCEYVYGRMSHIKAALGLELCCCGVCLMAVSLTTYFSSSIACQAPHGVLWHSVVQLTKYAMVLIFWNLLLVHINEQPLARTASCFQSCSYTIHSAGLILVGRCAESTTSSHWTSYSALDCSAWSPYGENYSVARSPVVSPSQRCTLTPLSALLDLSKKV